MKSVDALTADLAWRNGASPTEIEAAQNQLRVTFPVDLVEFLTRADGAEGFIAAAYIAFWPVSEMARLNRKAQISDSHGSIVILATNGGGHGYGIDRATGQW